MNKIIDTAKRLNLCEQGHFVIGDVHTNINIPPINYITNCIIGEQVVFALYNKIRDKHFTDREEFDFDLILTEDSLSTTLAFPLSLMFKCNIYDNCQITPKNLNKIILITNITDYKLNEIHKMTTLHENVINIYCVTNLSSSIVINGINIIELLPIEKWGISDCPICNLEEDK